MIYHSNALTIFSTYYGLSKHGYLCRAIFTHASVLFWNDHHIQQVVSRISISIEYSEERQWPACRDGVSMICVIDVFCAVCFILDRVSTKLDGIDLRNVIRLVHIASHDIYIVLNSSLPGQSGRHFVDDIFGCIFVNEKCYILIKTLLKFVPYGPIDNKPTLVKIMAWRRIGDKPLSELMLSRFTDAYMRH